ncbi:CDI toxin immunity protein [Paenibacillus sp. GSMTC-2017]|uniref:CDI toxin immunity protein n=1 Tax=Paenibacillus sp. GSMTC-2017 TaxID=2794350 RepID=UPI003FA7BCCC
MQYIDFDDNYYVVWDSLNLPVIEASLTRIVKYYDDVIAVAFDTWIKWWNDNRIYEIVFN